MKTFYNLGDLFSLLQVNRPCQIVLIVMEEVIVLFLVMKLSLGHVMLDITVSEKQTDLTQQVRHEESR